MGAFAPIAGHESVNKMTRSRQTVIRKIACLAFVSLLAANPLVALAGSLKVVPVKVLFDGSSKTSSLTVTNGGQERITLQLEAKSWDQDSHGADSFSETGDIIFFPKILELEPSAEKIIRIGYQGERRSASEEAYRIFLRELPVARPGETALRFAITLSIPIFISPSTEPSDVRITDVTQENGELRVRVSNDGNTHAMVKTIKITGLDTAGDAVFSSETRGWYLLAGKSRTYELAVPENNCAKAAKVEVEVQAESQTVAVLVDADTAMCGSQPRGENEPAGSERGR